MAEPSKYPIIERLADLRASTVGYQTRDLVIECVQLYRELQQANERMEKMGKAIPADPTPEMLKAGAKMFEQTLYSSADFEHHAFHVYCAMVDAALNDSGEKTSG